MELTIGEVLQAAQSVKNISVQPLAAKASYRLMRIAKKLAGEVKTFEEKRMELLKKYGQEVEEEVSKCCKTLITKAEGVANKCSKCAKECETELKKKIGYFQIKPENTEAFTKDINDIADTKINISIDQIPLLLLGEAKISGQDMSGLDCLIDARE